MAFSSFSVFRDVNGWGVLGSLDGEGADGQRTVDGEGGWFGMCWWMIWDIGGDRWVRNVGV